GAGRVAWRRPGPAGLPWPRRRRGGGCGGRASPSSGKGATETPRALLTTTPAAARAAARGVTAIRDTLRGGGWWVEVLATARPGDARRFAAAAPEQGFDVLVCYGGDGTAMQVAAGAVGTGLPLGLVPGGTGNLLAGNLRLPRRPADAARLLLRARPRAIDLGRVERADGLHYFAVCGGTGFDARL